MFYRSLRFLREKGPTYTMDYFGGVGLILSLLLPGIAILNLQLQVSNFYYFRVLICQSLLGTTIFDFRAALALSENQDIFLITSVLL